MKTLVIFDLEATCWEDRASNVSEIIEVGAVRIERETGNIIDTFDVFVKPRINPILSDYCMNLTSIRQQDVDLGYDFVPAMHQFNKYLDKYYDDYIMSWGYYDKNQILKEIVDKNSPMLELETKLYQRHLNAKNQFCHIMGVKRYGIIKALKILNLQFEGTHHRGIDDCENVARIYREIKDKFFETIYSAD